MTWRRTFPKVRKVVLGGGWPCVNQSRLNADPQGALAPSSLLLEDLLNIRGWLKECSRPLRLADWEVIEVFEHVVMDATDLLARSKKIG